MTNIIRIIRILEYVGPRDVIEKTLSHAAVPLNGERHFGQSCIRSAVLGIFPEVMQRGEDSEVASNEGDEGDPNHGG